MKTIGWLALLTLAVAFASLALGQRKASRAGLKSHGDIVVYISPSRHIARFVRGYRHEFDSAISLSSDSSRNSIKVSEVANSDQLAEFCENQEDLEGDVHRYVHS